MRALIINLSFLFGASLTMAQNVGIGNTDPKAKLDVSGDLILKSATLTLLNGNTIDLDVITNRYNHYKLEGPTSNFQIGGILAAEQDRIITLYNRAGHSLEIYNDYATVDLEKRILTGTGTTFVVFPGGSVTLKYDNIIDKWEITASHNNNLNYFGDTNWSLTGVDIYNSNNGKVGVGTSTPSAILTINGNLALLSDTIYGPCGTMSMESRVIIDNAIKNRSVLHIVEDPSCSFTFPPQIMGLTGGSDGKLITLITHLNYTSIKHLQSLIPNPSISDSANMIELYEPSFNGSINEPSQLNLAKGGAITLIYDGTRHRWTPLNYYGEIKSVLSESWHLSGNSGTTVTNYIGTNDEQPLQFRVNNVKSGIIDSAKANTAFGYSSFKNNTTGSGNTAAGASALLNNTNGYSNTAIGHLALSANTGGYHNTAIGKEALLSNTNGFSNTATGSGALYSNTTGYYNVANGGAALAANTTGHFNTAIGNQVLYSNTTGSQNTATGQFALYNNTTGYDNTANGASALYFNTIGYNNIANGNFALYSNTTGYRNTAMGASALYKNLTGRWNTAIGGSALLNNSAGLENTAIGDEALLSNSTGQFNTATGSVALYSNTTGSSNTANGEGSLYSNTTGNSNVAIGIRALFHNTYRSNLVAIGDSTLFNNEYGFNNIAIGSKALYSNTTGEDNTAIGRNALYKNTIASGNTATGVSALYNNISTSNTANGYRALFSNNTGFQNTATGENSLYWNTSGIRNTANGSLALSSNVTGIANTANGNYALEFNTTGSYNIAMGYDAGYYNTTTADNQIAIGNTTGTGGANKAIIGNSSQTWIGGQVAWSAISDARIKEQVQTDVPGLSFITALRPVTYHLNIHKQKEIMDRLLGDRAKTDTLPDWEGKYDIEKIKMTGFLAQEVEAAAKKINYDFSGVDVPKVDGGLYSLRYSEFVVPLVKAVQEQQTMIEQLKIQNELLLKRLEKLENK